MKSQYKNGQRVIVKVNGNRAIAEVVGWDDSLNCPKVNYNGRTFSRRVFGLADSATIDDNGNVQLLNDEQVAALTPQVPAESWDINERFGFIDKMIDMLLDSKKLFSMILTGSGGLGKSTSVTLRLEAHKLEEDEDFVVVKGFATPKALYRVLFENADKLVVFDDCDSVLDNFQSFNILKAALDDKKIRKISWRTEQRGDEEDLPQDFEFTGKVIFISNKKLASFDKAILSRSLFVDVTMTADEKILRIETLAAKIEADADEDERKDAIELLREVRNQAKELSLRTYKKVVHLRMTNPDDWKPMAKYMLLTGPADAADA